MKRPILTQEQRADRKRMFDAWHLLPAKDQRVIAKFILVLDRLSKADGLAVCNMVSLAARHPQMLEKPPAARPATRVM